MRLSINSDYFIEGGKVSLNRCFAHKLYIDSIALSIIGDFIS